MVRYFRKNNEAAAFVNDLLNDHYGGGSLFLHAQNKGSRTFRSSSQ